MKKLFAFLLTIILSFSATACRLSSDATKQPTETTTLISLATRFTIEPTIAVTTVATSKPTTVPTTIPSTAAATNPTIAPTAASTVAPTSEPTVPTVSSATTTIASEIADDENYHGHVYTGGESSKKYHYEEKCAGKYSHEITWEEVEERNLGPCGTCVLK